MSASVDNAPPAADIIALNAGGTKTITFSQTVVDPLLALVSWNNNVVDFGVPIEILSGNGNDVPEPASLALLSLGLLDLAAQRKK